MPARNKTECPPDFSGILIQPHMKGNMPEQDHIYSQDELAKAKYTTEQINSIYNIRLIGGIPNKIKSNMTFSKWMSKYGKDKDELKKHLIPNNSTGNIKDYEKFLAERKKLMNACFNY
jgi:hypothetical protein